MFVKLGYWIDKIVLYWLNLVIIKKFLFYKQDNKPKKNNNIKIWAGLAWFGLLPILSQKIK